MGGGVQYCGALKFPGWREWNKRFQKRDKLILISFAGTQNNSWQHNQLSKMAFVFCVLRFCKKAAWKSMTRFFLLSKLSKKKHSRGWKAVSLDQWIGANKYNCKNLVVNVEKQRMVQIYLWQKLIIQWTKLHKKVRWLKEGTVTQNNIKKEKALLHARCLSQKSNDQPSQSSRFSKKKKKKKRNADRSVH